MAGGRGGQLCEAGLKESRAPKADRFRLCGPQEAHHIGARLRPVDRFDFGGKGFFEPDCIDGEVGIAGPRAGLAERCLQKGKVWCRPARHVPVEIEPVPPLKARPAQHGMDLERQVG